MRYAKNIIYIILGLISLSSLFLITFTSSYIILDKIKPSSSAGKNLVASVSNNIPKAYVIQSGSMEPAIKTASIVISTPQTTYVPGDIITFKPEGRATDFVTHRIEFKEFPKGVEGDAVYKTSGDANEDFDRWEITNEQIVGKVAFSIPYLGYVADFAKKPQGFILLVIVPATIVIYEELRFLIAGLFRSIKKFRKKKGSDNEKRNGLPKASTIIPIFGAGILLIGLANSFFSDTEQSAENVLTAWTEEVTPTPTDTPFASSQVEETTIYLNQLGGDIEDQYGYNHVYTSAADNNVYFTYITPSLDKLSGVLSATGLKPYTTYQAKFEGIPACADSSGNDLANEYIGYKGRWTCTDCTGSAVDRNRTDAQYLANSHFQGDSSECIVGYLVWDFFTADPTGNATAPLETLNSYHVLWCGGGTCDTNVNTYLNTPDGSHPSLQFCPADKVNGEIERFSCGGISLDPGNYDLKMTLTEESFHQGSWATVLVGNISFEILSTP